MNGIYYHNAFNRDRLVYIVDSERANCDALSVLFRLEGFQTAYFLTIDELLAGLEFRRPDVVIADLTVDGEDSLPAIRRVKNLRLGIPIFMTTGEADLHRAVEAMREGVHDVLHKPVDTEKLLGGVRDALRRDVHIGAVQGGRRPIEIRGFNQLTPREREVLQLITNGQSNKEAGRVLGISPRTIEVHRARVMEKLGARNTADLVRIVLTS
ncbi:response regulator transcription factor [Cucumibacter marinus]|uniref:response regulator transcription factor n=1 Tax=Cucumibacter marinus TaxID=1121252 RepID=UPI0004258416|nr:LuxR C-terminal-related transcriptional regulator [Cucumibacter marinus]